MVMEPVLLVSDGVVLVLEHDGRRFSIPRDELQCGSTVSDAGDRGRLVISRDAADRVGLP